MFSMFNNSDVTLDGLSQQALVMPVTLLLRFGQTPARLVKCWLGIRPCGWRLKLWMVASAKSLSYASENQIIRGVEPVMLAGNWVDQSSLSWDAVPCRVYVTVTAEMLQAAMGFPRWVGIGMYQSNLQMEWPVQKLISLPMIARTSRLDGISISIYPGDRFRVTLVRNGGNPVQIGGTAGRWKMKDGSAVNWPIIGGSNLSTWHFEAFLDRMNCVAYIMDEVRIAAG
jgi:hypothetical protein